jgi:hypothetical protein
MLDIAPSICRREHNGSLCHQRLAWATAGDGNSVNLIRTLILACGEIDSWAPSSACGQGADIPLYFRAFLQLDVSEGRTQHESASASFGISDSN